MVVRLNTGPARPLPPPQSHWCSTPAHISRPHCAVQVATGQAGPKSFSELSVDSEPGHTCDTNIKQCKNGETMQFKQ